MQVFLNAGELFYHLYSISSDKLLITTKSLIEISINLGNLERQKG
jgi:hypothetical protein